MTVSHLTRTRDQLWSDLLVALGGSEAFLTRSLSDRKILLEILETYGSSVSLLTIDDVDALLSAVVNAAGGSASHLRQNKHEMLAALVTALGGTAPSASSSSIGELLAACVNAADTGSGGGGPYEGPLDIIPGAAVAFSLSRALSIDWIGQNVVTLRRDSDDVTMDFVAGEDGLVEVAAVTTWLSGANGYVATVYDQSGNANDCVQADTAKQPPWVTSAVNGHPAMQIIDPATPIEVRCGAISYPNGGWTGFIVGRGQLCRFVAVLGGPPDMEFNANRNPALQDPIYVVDNDGDDLGIGATTVFDGTAFHLYDGKANFNECDHYSDGASDGANEFTDGTGPLDAFTINPSKWMIGGGNSGEQCGSAEVIIYPTFPTNPDRALVRQNMADYYGITLAGGGGGDEFVLQLGGLNLQLGGQDLTLGA